MCGVPSENSVEEQLWHDRKFVLRHDNRDKFDKAKMAISSHLSRKEELASENSFSIPEYIAENKKWCIK